MNRMCQYLCKNHLIDSRKGRCSSFGEKQVCSLVTLVSSTSSNGNLNNNAVFINVLENCKKSEFRRTHKLNMMSIVQRYWARLLYHPVAAYYFTFIYIIMHTRCTRNNIRNIIILL